MSQYKNLQSDILYLYAKTKHKGIESLYLKMAEASFSQIKNFLSKSLNKINISVKTKYTLNSLIGIYDNMKNDFSIWNFIQVLKNDPSYYDNFSNIKLIGEIYDEGKFSEILSPFAQIFSMSKIAVARDDTEKSLAATISKKDMEDDLVKLEKFYNQKNEKINIYDTSEKTKEIKENKIILSIRYCFTELLSELVSVANSRGLTDVANILTPENIVDSKKIISYFGIPSNMTILISDAQNLHKDILKKIKKSSLFNIADAIRTRGLYHSNIISKNTMQQHFYEKSINIKDIIGNSEEKIDKKIQVEQGSILNPIYIIYISLVLYLLNSSK